MLITDSIFFSSFRDNKLIRNVNKLRKMFKIKNSLNVLIFGFEYDINLKIKL